MFSTAHKTVKQHFVSDLSTNHKLQIDVTSSQDTRMADDVIMSTSDNSFPPNIAISPGSCKSPYFCTSPGFCNFPFHNYKPRRCVGHSGTDNPHGAVIKTRSDPISRDQVFIRDSAEPGEMDQPETDITRRYSMPAVHDPLPVIKPDQLSLPELNDQCDIMDSLVPVKSLSSPSTSSLSSSASSIFNDPLLSDVTNHDVIGLLRSPKVETMDTNNCPNDYGVSDKNTVNTSTFKGRGSIRRSPPPPNVTLNPKRHMRSTLPPGILHSCLTSLLLFK